MCSCDLPLHDLLEFLVHAKLCFIINFDHILTCVFFVLAEREAVNAAERAVRKQQLRDKVSKLSLCHIPTTKNQC